MNTTARAEELVEVLLIEDSQADAEFIVWALRERGLGRHVKVVQDGQAALDYMFRLGPYRDIQESQLPRLVILEHRIPKRSCLDVLQAMKTDPDFKTVPVVVLSASEDEQDRDACLAAGANSFVAKPVSPDKFGDIIGQVAIYWMLVHAARGYRPAPHTAGLPADALSPPVDGQPLLRVLIVDRTESQGAPVRGALERGGFRLESDLVNSQEQLAERLDQNSYDVVIAANRLSGWTGLDALRTLRRSGDDTPFLLVTDRIPDAEALQYLNEGAADYIYNDRLSRLPVAVRRALDDRAMAHERQVAQDKRRAQELAGVVAHDFNNLLMAITGYTALLLDRVPAGSTIRTDLEEVDRAAKRGATLTHQLLAFSRRQVLQPKILDVNAIIADMDGALRRILGGNIDLVTITDDILGRINADPGQLQQVLLNLAVNARDAMPNGGRLLIESSDTTVDAEYAERHRPLVPGEYVQLTISDNGVGMTDEVKARLFEPFFTTKRRDAGTGLGLASAYGIVKQSGGYIYVNSAPRRGSTFIIYLPRVDEDPDEVAPTPTSTPKSGTETLLVVEDEDTVRTLVTRILRERGYTVLVAPDGEEGLRLALDWEGPIDLVVTDVVMPSMSGPDMVSRLAERRREFPVVFMSGYTELALSPVNVLPDDTAFLQKPFTPDALLGKIREVLDQGQSEPPAEH